MSTISKALSGILFNGTDLALAAAPWKNKVSAIYGFNAAGSGYTLFKPISNFNSLTKLVQDGAYIVVATAPGFDLPGATLTAAGGAGGPGLGAGPLSFTTFGVTNAGSVQLTVNLASTDAGDHVVLVATDAYPAGAFKLDLSSENVIGLGTLPAGAAYTVSAVNRLGNLLTRTFTVPAAS